jgi:hypothetical protein
MFDHKNYRPPIDTKLTIPQAVYALKEGYKSIFGKEPTDNIIKGLFAQTMLETGRYQLTKNNNWGNIKTSKERIDDGYLFTMFATGENLTKNGVTKYEWFEPPHMQTWFRHYDTPEEGAADYIRFLSQRKRYAKAWEILQTGNIDAFSRELSARGYYTANVDKYTNTMVKLSQEYMRKKAEYDHYVPQTISEVIKEDLETTMPDNDDIVFVTKIDVDPRPDELEIEALTPYKKSTSLIIAFAISAFIGYLTSFLPHCQ